MVGTDAEPRLLVVTGPTASGKSDLAVALAAHLGGEVISADAMQVYRGLDVGTAKLPLADRRGVPHHLLDVRSVDEPWHVSGWVTAARAVARDVAGRGHWPVVCGGTPLWVAALIHGYRFAAAGADPAVRRRLTDEAEQLGPGVLHRRLGDVDPTAAAHIDPGDTRRIVRALEVFAASGQALSAQVGRDKPADALVVAPAWPREPLHRRIEQRVDAMLGGGWIDETVHLAAAGAAPALRRLRPVGYVPLLEWLEGHRSLAAARADTVAATRQLAKRQLTWFRHDTAIRWLPAGPTARTEELAGTVLLWHRERWGQDAVPWPEDCLLTPPDQR